MSFQYKKFPDGSWTVIAPVDAAKLNQGDRVSVTTRAGKEKTETITALLCTLADGRHVYRIEQKAKADPKADLLTALRVIASQSIGDDWTLEQAFAFIREHARAAIAKAEGVAP